ncbi:MAG: hypothetical protein ACM3L6_08120 [Deltaproteobacteria bacterium]
MSKLRKGMRLVCVPCGRQVIVDACGVSERTVWCCGKPMAHKRRASKTSKKRTRSS